MKDHTRQVVCNTRHSVDSDDDDNERFAEVGEVGMATRISERPPEHEGAYMVEWAGGAWGFYSSEELAQTADMELLRPART